MTKRVIYLLETYAGFFICLLLDVWRFFTQLFVRRNLAYNPASGGLLFVKFIEQGALILHRPAFKAAVEQYGKSKVHICTFQSNVELVTLLDVFEEANILVIRDNNPLAFFLSFLTALASCRQRGIYAVIDLEFFSRATAIFCYLSGAAVRAGYHRFKGLQNYRGNLFTHRLNYSHYEHLSRTSLTLLRSIEQLPKTLPALNFDIADKVQLSAQPYQVLFQQQQIERVAAKFGMDKTTKYVVLTPNFNDPLPLRKWEEKNYAELIKRLEKEIAGAVFIITGRSDEVVAAGQFINRYGLNSALNLCGRTSLFELLAVYHLASLMICSDSGPGHFASVTPVPCVVLFGPETPVLYGPRGANIHFIYEGISCSPCFNVYNNRNSSCPDSLCMKKISVEKVAGHALALLSK